MVTKKSTPNRHTKPHGDPYHNERVRMHRTADRAIDTSENAKYDGASGLKEMTKKKKVTRPRVLGLYGGSPDAYTQIRMSEWEGCSKKKMDRGCEDCGAGNHCPLLKRFDERAKIVLERFVGDKSINKDKFLTPQRARLNAKLWCEGIDHQLKDRRAIISKLNKSNTPVIIEVYKDSPTGIPHKVYPPGGR